jgi:hypothetical protein
MTEAVALLEYMPPDSGVMRVLDVERALDLLRGCEDFRFILEVHDQAVAARELAKVKKVGTETYNAAQYVVMRAQRELGRLLELQGNRPGKPQLSPLRQLGPTLKAIGVSRSEASRARELAAIPDTAFEAYVARVNKKGEKLTTTGAIEALSDAEDYDSDEFYTPEDPWILAIREVMGGIDVDPASTELAQNVVQARIFYTKRDNGLTKRWPGRVLLNRPYSPKLSDQFAQKLLDEVEAKRTTQAISIQNATPSTEMFQRHGERAYVCLPEGRINFWTSKGKTVANRNDSAFFYFGPRAKRFCEVFGEFGLTGKLTRSTARLFKRSRGE